MKSQFLKREYPEKVKMDKVQFSNIERKSNSKTQKGISLVVTYHTLLRSLSSMVNNNIYLLHMDRSASKLSSYLVRVKQYPKKGKQIRVNVMVNALKCIKIYYKLICLLVVIIKLLKSKSDCNEIGLVYLIPGNLIEEKTICSNTLTNIFSYQSHTDFLQDTYDTLIDKTDRRAPTKCENY